MDLSNPGFIMAAMALAVVWLALSSLFFQGSHAHRVISIIEADGNRRTAKILMVLYLLFWPLGMLMIVFFTFLSFLFGGTHQRWI